MRTTVPRIASGTFVTKLAQNKTLFLTTSIKAGDQNLLLYFQRYYYEVRLLSLARPADSPKFRWVLDNFFNRSLCGPAKKFLGGLKVYQPLKEGVPSRRFITMGDTVAKDIF